MIMECGLAGEGFWWRTSNRAVPLIRVSVVREAGAPVVAVVSVADVAPKVPFHDHEAFACVEDAELS
jgi:hypothetical protein